MSRRSSKKRRGKSRSGLFASLQRAGTDRRDMMSIWDLSGQDTYVRPRRARRLPRWFLPSVAVILLVALIFWGIPALVAYWGIGQDREDGGSGTVTTLYGIHHRVVKKTVADVFGDDDIRADRVTQVLYNEPVELLHDDTVTIGFRRVRTLDGLTGFMLEADLTDVLVSVEPTGHISEILVTDILRRIMTHESSGTLLAQIPMGTRLMADYKGNGVFRVTLPGGGKGWIGANGTMEIPLEEGETVPVSGGRYFVHSALGFLNVPHVRNGLTRFGACPEGIATIAARVNGVTLPRTREGQLLSGSEVPVTRDETGKLDFDMFQQGDLLFFSETPVKFLPEGTEPRPARTGIVVDYAQVLTYRTGRADIRVVSLLTDTDLADRLFAARRIFEHVGPDREDQDLQEDITVPTQP